MCQFLRQAPHAARLAGALLVTGALLGANAFAAPPTSAQSGAAQGAAAQPVPQPGAGPIDQKKLQKFKKAAGSVGAAVSATMPEQGTPAAEAAPDTRSLDEQIQGLKKDVVDLNKDLFVLEEELLFPANTQVAVFLSVDIGDFFALDSVQLKIDQKQVIDYLYTPREVDALLKGGVQRLYLGNLKVGSHELVAFFNGKGPNDRAYKRGASLKFEKGVGAKYLELKIDDRQRKLQPEFEIKDWE